MAELGKVEVPILTQLIGLEVQKLELKEGDVLFIRIPEASTLEMYDYAEKVRREVYALTKVVAEIIPSSWELTVATPWPAVKS